MRPVAQTRWPRAIFGWFLLAAIIAVVIVAVRPPRATPESTPVTEFSSARALAQLRQIAQRPHPVGSAEHDRVRDLLLADISALGLHPQVESYTGVETIGHAIIAGKISNITARLPGVANTRAVVLTAHYDSVERAPGAGDDGGGVVTILETMRAIMAGPPLKNDVIVLLTDGEENGLLGAHAAAAHDPWVRDGSAGVLFNIEGRGDRGVSSLFETSSGNRRLIEEFAKAVPYPFGSSLAYSIYKMLPNDTDFTVFRRAGVAGLNFAWIGGFEAYHSRLDTPANLDERSLAHDGTYALALTRHFGDLDLNQVALHDRKDQDEVFFNWFGSSLVHYPVTWVVPLFIAATILWFAVLALCLRKRVLGWGGFAAGFAASLTITIAAFIVTIAIFWLINLTFGKRLLFGDVPSNELLLIALILFATVVATAVFLWFRKRIGTIAIAGGGLLLFWIVTAVLTVLLPTGSYIFFWPMVFATLAFALLAAGSPRAAWIAAIPIVLFFAPLLDSTFTTLSLSMIYAGICGLLLGLGWALLAPTLDLLLPAYKSFRAVYSLLALAILLTITGIVMSKPSAAHPRQDTLTYAVDSDNSKAAWISYDDAPDAWTANYLTRSPHRGRMPDYLGGSDFSVLWSQAPFIPHDPPSIEIIDNQPADGTRTLRLRVRSVRNAPQQRIRFDSGAEIIAANIDGEPVSFESRKKVNDLSTWRVDLAGYGEVPVELSLTIKNAKGCRYWLSDRSYALPDIPNINLPPRPDDFMAWYGSDQLIVSRTLNFCQ